MQISHGLWSGIFKDWRGGESPPTRLRGFKLPRSSVHNAVEERNLHRLKFCPWLPRHLEGKMSRAINISTLVTSEKCCFLQKNRCTTTLGVGPLVTLLQEIFWIAVSFVMLFEVWWWHQMKQLWDDAIKRSCIFKIAGCFLGTPSAGKNALIEKKKKLILVC